MKNFTTRFLFIGLLFILSNSNNSYAQQIVGQTPQQKSVKGKQGQTQQSETVAVTGKLIRVTPKLADIDNTTMYGEPLVITRDANGKIGRPKELKETKERLLLEMKERIAREYNEAIKDSKTENLQGPGTMINPNIPGTSIGVNMDGLTSPGLQPTDKNMAAGPNHIIQTVNILN